MKKFLHSLAQGMISAESRLTPLERKRPTHVTELLR
jgi:hypothetical protein